jgi:elongation factor Ts
MPEITANLVAELRASTGAGLMDCKKALVEANGDTEQAVAILRKKGMATAAKKADRDATEGLVESYIHLGGKVGVLLEIKCETDFVAKNEQFRELARDIAMHVAAASPLYVSREDVPEEVLEKEREIASSQAEGKPAQAVQKIVEGKLAKYFASVCLLEQPFVKNPDQTVQELLTDSIAKIGENILIGRFARFQLGE